MDLSSDAVIVTERVKEGGGGWLVIIQLHIHLSLKTLMMAQNFVSGEKKKEKSVKRGSVSPS